MGNVKCGIYEIRCHRNGRIYIGSSTFIHQRWYQHRRALALGTHHSPHLQAAWNKYGEDAFAFAIIEECERTALEQREQFYIDALTPFFNSVTDVSRRQGPEMAAKRAASLRARAALITHCPKGHPYDEANTMIHQGKRVCRKCNAERVADIFASETPEEREARREYAKSQYEKNREDPAYKASMREYYDAHLEEKKAYDAGRRQLINERLRKKREEATPEEREAKRQAKRAYYAANRERAQAQLRASYRRRQERKLAPA